MVARIALLTVLALALPVAAAAKGPESASFTGPGLHGSVPITGLGESGPGTPLGTLVFDGGFFPAMFGQSPDPMLKARPTGELGPRYTVAYVVPGPNGKSTIRQDVYPYAKPVPVTYMKPGQPFWDGQKTYGGWFVAQPSVKSALVRAGLSSTAPAGVGAFWRAWMLAPILAAAGFVALAALRRQWHARGSRPLADAS
jgi:hypothetical protein